MIDVCSHFHQITLQGASSLQSNDLYVNHQGILQGKAGKAEGIKDGIDNDEGGHLIASIFDGPGEQINYAAMDGNLNKGAWKAMENKWAEALKEVPPKKVSVSIEAIYENNSKRPVAFDVTYFIDGKKKSGSFVNQPGG